MVKKKRAKAINKNKPGLTLGFLKIVDAYMASKYDMTPQSEVKETDLVSGAVLDPSFQADIPETGVTRERDQLPEPGNALPINSSTDAGATEVGSDQHTDDQIKVLFEQPTPYQESKGNPGSSETNTSIDVVKSPVDKGVINRTAMMQTQLLQNAVHLPPEECLVITNSVAQASNYNIVNDLGSLVQSLGSIINDSYGNDCRLHNNTDDVSASPANSSTSEDACFENNTPSTDFNNKVSVKKLVQKHNSLTSSSNCNKKDLDSMVNEVSKTNSRTSDSMAVHHSPGNIKETTYPTYLKNEAPSADSSGNIGSVRHAHKHTTGATSNQEPEHDSGSSEPNTSTDSFTLTNNSWGQLFKGPGKPLQEKGSVIANSVILAPNRVENNCTLPISTDDVSASPVNKSTSEDAYCSPSTDFRCKAGSVKQAHKHPITEATSNGSDDHPGSICCVCTPKPGTFVLKDQSVQCNLDEWDTAAGVLHGTKIIFSENKKEFIKMEIKNYNFFYSCQFSYQLEHCEMVVRVNGTDSLLTADYGNFVARIKLSGEGELDFVKPFGDNKIHLCRRICIIKILEDKLLDRRNKAFSRLTKALEDRTNATIEIPDYTEDIFQLHLIGNFLKNSNRITNGNLDILQIIISNAYITNTFKEIVEQFLHVEKGFKNRNDNLPRYSNIDIVAIADLPTVIWNTSKRGIQNHREYLLKIRPVYNNIPLDLSLDINDLPDITLLFVSSKDLKLFADLVTLVEQQTDSADEILWSNLLGSLWKSFYDGVKQIKKQESLKTVGNLTNPIYLFLFKSFLELTLEVSIRAEISSQDLIKIHNEKFQLIKSISWVTNSTVNNAFEQQYRLVFKLMEHFQPGRSSDNKRFEYEFKLFQERNISWMGRFRSKNVSTMSAERLVWLYVLDCGLAQILPKKPNAHVQKLSKSLLEGFEKLIKDSKYDRYESFRSACGNITKFAAHISPYISNLGDKTMGIDYSILDKQIKVIGDMLVSEDNDLVMNHFSSLIDLYNDFWKHRESILEKLLKECPCRIFQSDKSDIFFSLLNVMNTALSKNTTTEIVIGFFRFYNEFLAHFKGVDLEWLVEKLQMKSADSWTSDVVEIANSKQKTYKVLEAEQFVGILESKKDIVPKHYVLEVVKRLLSIVNDSLEKSNWSDYDRVKLAGDLLLAISHSLSFLADQRKNVDFERFLEDCTLPFSNAIINCQTYDEVKHRLDNVENFYLHTRKQDQLSIKVALDLCLKETDKALKMGFSSNMNRTILQACFKKYETKFASLVALDIESIIDEMSKELIGVPRITGWTPTFKQNTLPLVLASLAAVWSKLESKDVASVGKRIEPHCVQILCILILLGVDQQTQGIKSQIAQVLTGQGKSVVLGLLSSLLAVTGHEAYVVCYSKYLANRDELAFKSYFQVLHKFEVEKKVVYDTLDGMASKQLNIKVNGEEENVRSLVQKLTLNTLSAQNIESRERSELKILVIDEIDLFFDENIYVNMYNACTTVNISALLDIQPKLWEIVEEGLHDKDTVLEKINNFINDLLRDSQSFEFRKFMKSSNSLFRDHLDMMVRQAIDVSKAKKEKSDVWYIEKYAINYDGYVGFRSYYGLYENTQICEYYNIFNYFRLKKADFDHKCYKNYGYLQLDCGGLSYAKLPKEFPKILGVSGTVTELNSFERQAIKSSGITEMVVMPSYFGSRNLKYSGLVLKDTESDWLDAIFDRVNHTMQKGRAAIVFFDTEREIDKFEKQFGSKIKCLRRLTGNEEPSLVERYVSEAGNFQTVTLATKGMSRGVDYKQNDLSVEKNEGVQVIQTFLSVQIRDQLQTEGRCARKSNSGIYQLILCREHLEQIGCSKNNDGTPVTNYTQLHAVRMRKADLISKEHDNTIKGFELTHNKTIEFLKSFSSYKPEDRDTLMKKFPFVPLDEDLKK